MKAKTIIALFSATLFLGGIVAQSQTPTTAAPAASPSSSSVKSELQTIINNIQTKLKANNGKVTAADLAPDLAAFDALLAKHAGEKTDEMATVAYMKAILYPQVLNDRKTGDELLQKLKADYKDTKFVASLLKQEAVRNEAKKQKASLAAGLPFPDFSEKDLAGKPISVGALKGKVVLVDFWATWCGPCVRELPNVIAAYKKHHGEGFEIIGVSLDEDRAKLDAFLKTKEGMTWAQYFDGKGWENNLAVKYGVESIPFTVLVGKDGKIIGTDLRGEELEAAVATALAQK